MANLNPKPRQPSDTHRTAQLRVYLPKSLADEIVKLPKGQRAKTLGRWLMLGQQAEEQEKASRATERHQPEQEFSMSRVDPTTNLADCPHADCFDQLRVRPGTPDGVYRCKCDGCIVRVYSETAMYGGKVRHVRLATAEESQQWKEA